MYRKDAWSFDKIMWLYFFQVIGFGVEDMKNFAMQISSPEPHEEKLFIEDREYILWFVSSSLLIAMDS